AHIYVLARSPQQETGYTNSKSYKMGSVTKSAYNDGYYRRVYTSTVVLKNLRNRLQLGEQ
ncbi:MAG: PilW family protein, partial [Gammaproteobacteria bacterium]|nr:PilW family protein [Gammaproteobacteria bacterium]